MMQINKELTTMRELHRSVFSSRNPSSFEVRPRGPVGAVPRGRAIPARGLPRDGDHPLTRTVDFLVWQGHPPGRVMDLTLPAYDRNRLARFLRWATSTHGAVIALSTTGFQYPHRTRRRSMAREPPGWKSECCRECCSGTRVRTSRGSRF
jgi:hypothetical protein